MAMTVALVVVDVVIEAVAANGVRVACEKIPFFRSVSFGIWINAGSRDETAEKSGLLHFLEHLVFKGTSRRDARTISKEIDELGGNVDAFTSREVTCYSARVLSDRLPQAFDLLADMVLNATFPEDEIERERQVILEEIRMGEDSPSDLIYDKLFEERFRQNSLGRPITGVAETVRSIMKVDLVAARRRNYSPRSIVVTACGDVEPERLVELVEQAFAGLAPVDTKRVRQADNPPQIKKAIIKPLEQEHLMIAGPGLPMSTKRRHELAVLDAILGSSISSRLFQKVREELGLAYSVYSFYDQFLDAGLFGVYAACSPDKLGETQKAIMGEIKKMVKEPPSADEVLRAQKMGFDTLKMSFESLSYRMGRMAYQNLYDKKRFTLDELLEGLSNVTVESVHALACELFEDKDFTQVALGPVPEDEVMALTD